MDTKRWMATNKQKQKNKDLDTQVEKKKSTASDRIKDLEDELAKTKYNKRTQHHIGLVKAKLAALKERQVQKSSGGKKGEGYTVKKSGNATVVLLGFPSVGKSTLLNDLTNQSSEVAAYAFTTLTCIPGLLKHKHAEIQILDVPGIVKGAAAGTGRGKEVLSVLRNADMAIIVLDVFHPEYKQVILKEVHDSYLRINQTRPDVKITKTERGGIQIGKTVALPELSDETIKGILKEFRISNAHVLIRTPINADQLIDVVEGNRKYIHAITLLNKIDIVDKKTLEEIKAKVNPDICISAQQKIGIEELKDVIFDSLEFIRIYLKEVGKPADMKEPLIMFKGCTIKDVCTKLHKDFITKFKFTRIWGKSAKFDGQKFLNLNKELLDEDILEIHIK